jgi:transposase InsO family protein
VGRKRVARRMREHRLQGVHRRRLGGLTRRDPQAVPASDLVERNFTSAAPDRLWVADLERHEAFLNRAVMKGHRRRLVAAGRLKLRAA